MLRTQAHSCCIRSVRLRTRSSPQRRPQTSRSRKALRQVVICADGLLTLLPEIVRHARIPALASGGFATGAGVVAALALGAAGIRCGTLFLPTHESFAHANHKQRILAAQGQYRLHRSVCYQLDAAFACARAVEQPYRKGQEPPGPAPSGRTAARSDCKRRRSPDPSLQR
ncbi:nitronate monooxygenase [Paraburkholderia hospita]|uniref:nitronate monooxygenase n=1 Tax=Paraburkholderia hospita TaxID=169430 RepID=UPI0030834DC1